MEETGEYRIQVVLYAFVCRLQAHRLIGNKTMHRTRAPRRIGIFKVCCQQLLAAFGLSVKAFARLIGSGHWLSAPRQ